MEPPHEPDKPPRRPVSATKRRRYTRSDKTDAQRRTAAWKHGEFAATIAAQTIPPCKRSHCPNRTGDCETRRELAARGKTPSRCVVALAVDEDVRKRYMDAIERGDMKGVSELAATILAAQHGLLISELAKIDDEGGFAVAQDVYNKDGDVVGCRLVENPRGELALKLSEMQGNTAAQQAITPKSGSERKRDEGVGGLLDSIRRRNELAAASGRNSLPSAAGPSVP